jgi:hypothetical protein
MLKRFFWVLWIFVMSCFFMAADSCENSDDRTDISGKEEGVYQCSSDADCIAVSEDCCDCRHGGKQKAMSLSAAKEWNKKLIAECLDIVCIQVISSDPSCQQKPKCIAGKCKLK